MFTNRISKAIVVLLVLAIASVTASFVTRSTSENHVDERYGEPPEKIAGLIAEQKIHREYILGERYGVTPQHEQSVQREYWLGERYGQAPSASLSTIEGANDFYQRHPDWTWAIKDQNAVIPLTGDSAFPDYYQRYPETASDYAPRHPELTAPAGDSIDRTDYYFRHPELTTPLTQSLETPRLACESPVDCR